MTRRATIEVRDAGENSPGSGSNRGAAVGATSSMSGRRGIPGVRRAAVRNTIARNTLAVALAVVTAGAALAGCGGHGSAADAPLVRVLSSTASGEGPFAGLTGRQVLERANTAMRAATALTFHEDGTKAGHTVHVRSVMADGGRCASTMRDDTGRRLQIIGTGSAYYLLGSAAFWRAAGLQSGSVKVLDGKWLRLPADAIGRGNTIASLCDKSRFMDRMASEVNVGTVTKSRPTTLRGARVLPLVHVKPTATTTLYVALTGEPYILGGVMPTTGGGRVTETFGDFGRTPRIVPPPSGRTVGPGDLGRPKDFSV